MNDEKLSNVSEFLSEQLEKINRHDSRGLSVIDFSNQSFREIPRQDNPAFMTQEDWDNIGQKGCVMICAERSLKNNELIRNRFSVLLITPSDIDSVNNVGIFWEEDLAISFANWFAQAYPLTPTA